MIPGSRLILHDAAAFVLDVTLASDTSNFDLRSRAVTAGWDQRRPLIASLKVNSGIVLSANSTGVFSLDTGTTAYPAGSRFTVDTRSAFVIGMGGQGGNNSGGNGFAGGPAVRVNLPTTWDNLGGTIGGGGGGGGAGTQSVGKSSSSNGGGGGGGRTGRTNAAGGSPNGGTGTFASPGAGGAGAPAGSDSGQGTDGASGGGWGASGASASTGGNGGGPGAAIVGNSNITWTNTGTRLGAIS